MSSENKSDFFGLEHVTIKDVMDAMKIQISDLFQIKWLTLFLQILFDFGVGLSIYSPYAEGDPLCILLHDNTFSQDLYYNEDHELS